MQQGRARRYPFLRRRWWIISVVLAIGGWLVLSQYGIVTRFKLESVNSRLDIALEQERRRLDSLRIYRRRLLYDTLLLEQLAREQFGMIRPDEAVIIVADSNR